MNNFAMLSTTLVVALGLTACSGGGGSRSNVNEANQPTVLPVKSELPVKQNKPTKPATNVGPTRAVYSKNTGAYYVAKAYDQKNATYALHELNYDKDLNFIIIDGLPARISFADLGTTSNDWIVLAGNAACCDHFSDTRFGVLEESVKKDPSVAYLYYNGRPSKHMPISGKLNYEGYFVVIGNHSKLDKKSPLLGNAKFTADFSNKELVGTLTEKTLKPISINAKLVDNTFEGKASSGDFATKAAVEGKFFGQNAKELGGIFTDKQNWGGSFGAERK